jgi:hypothetical protein
MGTSIVDRLSVPVNRCADSDVGADDRSASSAASAISWAGHGK